LATNWLSQRPNSSAVLQAATGTTSAFNNCLDEVRVNRNRAWLIFAALSWSISPASHASHTSGASWPRRAAIPKVRCTECFVEVMANPISIAANSPASYRGSTPTARRSQIRRRSNSVRARSNSSINAACRACAAASTRCCAANASINALAWSVVAPIDPPTSTSLP
jgi:hypothetical protein